MQFIPIQALYKSRCFQLEVNLIAIVTYWKTQAKKMLSVHGVRSGSLQSFGKVFCGMKSPEGFLFLKGMEKTCLEVILGHYRGSTDCIKHSLNSLSKS